MTARAAEDPHRQRLDRVSVEDKLDYPAWLNKPAPAYAAPRSDPEDEDRNAPASAD